MHAALRIAILAGLVLAGCGESEPPRARTRLAECAGKLREPAPPDEDAERPEPLLLEDFDEPPDGWSVTTDKDDVLAVDPTALEQEYGSEGGRTFLTLGGRAGGFYKLVPVEGDTPYAFHGVLRARDVVPVAQPFSGASFWLAESALAGSPRDLFSGEKHFERRHPVASAAGEEGWVERRLAFRTGPATRTLIVGCLFAIGEPLERGEVDFDQVVLERIDERQLWEFKAARAVSEAERGESGPARGDWRDRRLMEAMLGAENRPSLLCLPGEELEFELEIPREDPVLRCGLAPWTRDLYARTGSIVHWLRVDGREVLRASNPLSEPSAWQDVTVELSPWAGRRVKLALGVEGPMPGLFGAPEVLARSAPPEGWNVLLVSIDTLRADHVGAYGATSGATPHIDALAREGLVFEDASANAPYTLPAHATLFSGQFPLVHGALDRGRPLSSDRSPILAEILAAHGYRTQAFVGGGFLTPDFGFQAGFDGFAIGDPLRHPGSRYFAEFRRNFPEQSAAALTAESGVERVKHWIEAHATEPFFLFLHTYEVHDYDPPPEGVTCAQRGCTATFGDYRPFSFPRRIEPFPGTPEERAHVGHLYDAALADVDARLGSVLEELDRLGLTERTLVVVTSDHGEELYERGHLQHGKTLYEELLRIPLVMRIPGVAPGRPASPAMQVDIAPTILAALGIDLDPRMQGSDLLGSVRSPRMVWSEVEDGFVRKASLRVDGWKLVHGPLGADVRIPNEREWELYDLAGDPGEGAEASAREPARLATLQRQFEAFQEHLRTMRETLGPLGKGTEIDETTKRQLEHLGYAGGGE